MESSTQPARLVNDWFDTQLHELVGRNHSRHAGADNGDFGAMTFGRYSTEARGMANPLFVRERKVRAKYCDRLPGYTVSGNRLMRSGHWVGFDIEVYRPIATGAPNPTFSTGVVRGGSATAVPLGSMNRVS